MNLAIQKSTAKSKRTCGPPKCNDHYRLDGLSMFDDSLKILNMAINKWKAITSHLFDSSRPNSLTRVDDIAAKENEELEYEK